MGRKKLGPTFPPPSPDKVTVLWVSVGSVMFVRPHGWLRLKARARVQCPPGRSRPLLGRLRWWAVRPPHPRVARLYSQALVGALRNFIPVHLILSRQVWRPTTCRGEEAAPAA